MRAMPTTSRATGTGPETPSSLARMYAAIRAATRVPADEVRQVPARAPSTKAVEPCC